jgi:hypothetical protein
MTGYEDDRTGKEGRKIIVRERFGGGEGQQEDTRERRY